MMTHTDPSSSPAVAAGNGHGHLTWLEQVILHSQYILIILMVLLAAALRIIYGAP